MRRSHHLLANACCVPARCCVRSREQVDEYSEDYALLPGMGLPGRVGSSEAAGMAGVRMSYDTAIMNAMAGGLHAGHVWAWTHTASQMCL